MCFEKNCGLFGNENACDVFIVRLHMEKGNGVWEKSFEMFFKDVIPFPTY